MSLVDSLKTWDEAVANIGSESCVEDVKCSLKLFSEISKSSNASAKILFNMSSLSHAIHDYVSAEKFILESIKKDEHFSLAYFYLGTILSYVSRNSEVLDNFQRALTMLRGRSLINYQQLGLNVKIFEFEILYNQAVIFARIGNLNEAQKLINDVKSSPNVKENAFIYSQVSSVKTTSAISQLELYEKPRCLVFKPPKSKTANLQKKDYLGKSKVLCANSNITEQTSKSAPNSPQMPRRPQPLRSVSPLPQMRSNSSDFQSSSLLARTRALLTRSHSPISTISDSKAKPTRPCSPLAAVRDIPKQTLKLETKNGNQNSVLSKVVTKPPPKPQRETFPEEKPARKIFKVRFHSYETKESMLTMKEGLEALQKLACQLFGYDTGKVDLWYEAKNDQEEKKMIVSETDMQQLWQSNQGKVLNLWVFGKSQ